MATSFNTTNDAAAGGSKKLMAYNTIVGGTAAKSFSSA